jgi:hypothetical protein
MLRATDFFKNRLGVDEVKLLLIDTCIECECDRIAIVYAVEDVDKIISRMRWGDVVLWTLTKDMTFKFFKRLEIPALDRFAEKVISFFKHDKTAKM